MQLGRTSKFLKKRKKIREWRLDMFEIDEVKLEGAIERLKCRGFLKCYLIENERGLKWHVKC